MKALIPLTFQEEIIISFLSNFPSPSLFFPESSLTTPNAVPSVIYVLLTFFFYEFLVEVFFNSLGVLGFYFLFLLNAFFLLFLGLSFSLDSFLSNLNSSNAYIYFFFRLVYSFFGLIYFFFGVDFSIFYILYF